MPPTPGGGLWSRGRSAVVAALRNPRVRHETGWVIAHKGIEFVLTFVALKVFTNLLSRDAYGEFNLALLATMLLADLAVMPVNQAYYRYLHRAEAEGVARSAGTLLLRWNLGITVSVAALALLLTEPAGRWFGVGTWTVLGGGLFFFANRWRSLGLQELDIRRNRRGGTLQNLGYLSTQIAFVAAALLLFERTAAVALLASAAASAIFAFTGAGPLIRDIRARPEGGRSALGPMLWTFGVPYGALLVCQWVQNFAERYILAIQLDTDSVGLYVAAYQVCGIPYMLFASVFTTLVVPVAYQRARVVTDARQLWSADRILLASVGLYVVLGALLLLVYVFAGQPLLRLLTSEGFMLPATTIICLAAGRYIQCLGIVLQPFFAVHERMGASLIFRIVGGVLVVPISWYAIRWYGITGAAVGVLVAGLIYTLTVVAGPGGCISLVRAARRNALAAPSDKRTP